MSNVISEFDLGERSELDLLRTSRSDAEDQLARARLRLDRAQRRVRNIEVAVQSWTALVAQFEREGDPSAKRRRVDIQL
jgi:hypothetical protein